MKEELEDSEAVKELKGKGGVFQKGKQKKINA
jgi:hypothetical protein